MTNEEFKNIVMLVQKLKSNNNVQLDGSIAFLIEELNSKFNIIH